MLLDQVREINQVALIPFFIEFARGRFGEDVMFKELVKHAVHAADGVTH